MVTVVASVAEDEAEVVAAFRECRCDLQILAEEVVVRLVPVQIAGHGVQVDAQRFRWGGPNQLGVAVAAFELGERTNEAQDAPEPVGTHPADCECAHASAAAAADCPLVRIAGNRVPRGNTWRIGDSAELRVGFRPA